MAPAPKNVPPHLAKLWAKYTPQDGLVTRTVSPYRQDFMTSWIKNWPNSIKHKIEDNWKDVTPAIIFFFGTYYWGNAKYDQNVRSHRD